MRDILEKFLASKRPFYTALFSRFRGRFVGPSFQKISDIHGGMAEIHEEETDELGVLEAQYTDRKWREEQSPPSTGHGYAYSMYRKDVAVLITMLVFFISFFHRTRYRRTR